MESKYGEDGKCVGCEIWDCAGWEPWVWEQGTTRVRAREEPMVRWRRVMAHPCQAPHGHGTATPGVPHGDNCEVQCSPDVRKKPRFTHGRDNLHGDVSEKRLNTHAMERNVARIGEGECGNDKWMESESGE